MSEHDRDIVIFGYDDDPSKTEFQRITIPEKFDINFALNEAIKKLDKKSKDGFKVKSDYTWASWYEYVPIVVWSDSIAAEGRCGSYSEAKSQVVAEGGGYVYNLNDFTYEYVHVPTWKNRDQAKTTEEALQHLSAFIVQGFDGLSGDKLKEAEEFAKKWGVPFCTHLMSRIRKDFDVYQSQWNSSSAYC